MWFRKCTKEVPGERFAAEESARHVDAVIAHVESHDKEIEQMVGRLKQRERRNNFGESLIQAMRRGGEEAIRGSH